MAARASRSPLSEADRAAVKDEMRALLINLARARQTITYSDLCALLQTVTLHPHSFIFSRLLREVCGEEAAKGHGQLCALVVSKLTGMPSAGYFRRDELPGLRDEDIEAFWRAELEQVFEYWSER